MNLASYVWDLAGTYEQTLQATEQSSIMNQVLCLGLLGIGLASFQGMQEVKRLFQSRWTWVFTMYLAWCGFSILWSSEPLLGGRRYLALVVVSAGALLLGRNYYGQLTNPMGTLAKHLVFCGLTSALVVLALTGPEITWDNIINPKWMPAVRKSGPFLLYPLIAGIPAALYLYEEEGGQRRLFFLGLMLLALIVYKGRFQVVVAFMSGLGYFAALFAKKYWQTILVLMLIVCSGLFAYVMLPEVPGAATAAMREYISRGESLEGMSALTGRVPLWEYIWRDLDGHLVTGVGYGSYWSTERLMRIYHAVHWFAPTAHNGFLEELAGTGFIGLTLFIMVIISSGWLCMRPNPQMTAAGRYLALMLIVQYFAQNFADSLTQFALRYPFYLMLVVSATLTGPWTTKNLKGLWDGALIDQSRGRR
ncbi:MAG: O-antigen ligase family protein [Acidobacteria bacterium]|nr:O-antigen ligase family protein [Acidobacteriota bacterium]